MRRNLLNLLHTAGCGRLSISSIGGVLNSTVSKIDAFAENGTKLLRRVNGRSLSLHGA